MWLFFSSDTWSSWPIVNNILLPNVQIFLMCTFLFWDTFSAMSFFFLFSIVNCKIFYDWDKKKLSCIVVHLQSNKTKVMEMLSEPFSIEPSQDVIYLMEISGKNQLKPSSGYGSPIWFFVVFFQTFFIFIVSVIHK